MIQRSKKPVKTEIILGSKLVNENIINTKPKKKKPINEFVGGSKLVNENNIIINMPEPVKKKRKKKPKTQAEPEEISDEAKRNFQETASQYARGAYPPIPDSVDISTIKTTSALNSFTNSLRTIMGLPPVVPITSTTSPTVPVVPVRPVLTETSTVEASIPAVATTSDLSPPIASGVPTLSPPKPIDLSILLENENEFKGLFDYFYITIANYYEEKENKTNLLIGLNYYKENKDLFDNISDDKLNEQINKYIEKDYFDMSDEEKEVYKDDFKMQFENYKLSHVLDKTKTIKSNKKESNISKTLIDEEKENLKNEVIELSKDKEKLSDELDKLKTSQNTLFETDPLFNELEKEIQSKMDLEDKNTKLQQIINELLKEKNNRSIELLIKENKEINKMINKNDDALGPDELIKFYDMFQSISAKESSTKQPTESYTKQPYISGGSPSYIPQSVMSSSSLEQNVMSSPNPVPVKAPPKSKDFIYTYVPGQDNNYDPKRFGEAGLAEATSNPEIFYKTFYPKGIYTQKTFPLDDPKMALYPQKNDFLRVINNIPSSAGISSKTVPQLEIIFKDEYLKSLEIPENVPVDLPKLDNSLQGIDKLMNFMNVYFPLSITPEGFKRVFTPDVPLGNATTKTNNPTETELTKIINEFIIPKKEEYKRHYFEQYERNGDGYKKGDYKPYLIGSNNKNSSVPARDNAAKKLLKDFIELYPESLVKPESVPVVLEPICTKSADRAGLEVCYPASIYTDYLNQLITNNKIIELDLIYKKATSITPSPTLDNEIKIQEIIASSYRPDKANVIDNDFYVWLQEQTPPNPPIKPTVSETSDPNLLPKYYEYLNDLSTKNELVALTDEYIKATNDDFIFVNAPDSIKIQKIKDSNYIPTNKKNPEFFDWLSKNPNPTQTQTKEAPTTEPITEPTLLQKYYEYLNEMSFDFEGGGIEDEYVIATGDKFGGINRSSNYLIQKIKDSNYIPTKVKNKDFFRWFNNNQGISEPTQEPDPVINKTQTNENQVNLAYKITNVSYDDEDKPRRIDQLMLLNNYTSRNVSVYQDGTTIYFCSTGSRAELSSQAAQDWLQSNIAILMGITTSNLSSRFIEERKVLDELVSTLQPTIIIFCGHSLGGRLSNELFTYSIESKRNVYQPFSITFNAGSVFHTSFTDKYNNEYLQHRVLQFHANYDPLSATNTIGTVVNVPFTGTYPHSMTNFENVDYSLYKNFVSEGLTFTETINPSYVVPEAIVEPKPEKETKIMDLIRKMYELEPSKRNNYNTEQYINADKYYDENREYFKTIDIEPFFRKYTINEPEFNFYMNVFSNFKNKPQAAETDRGKDLKLMSYINQLWEMNRDDDFDTTEIFTKTQEYYNKNKEYFDSLNEYGRKQMAITGYFDRQGTIRPKAERYLFFLNLFDRLSRPTTSEPINPEKEQKLLNLLGQLFELDDNERYNQGSDQYINAAIYFNDNKEYFNNLDIPDFLDKNVSSDDQYNFYINTIRDFNYRPRPESRPTTRPEDQYETPIGGYIGAAIGTLAGGISSGGNPIVAGGAGAAGFLAGNTIENAIEGKPSPAQPIGSFNP
jgi:hypothetical protein